MRIIRCRSGFQADHSSSSYVFYAVDKPVSAKGQQIAGRYSSRAEVDDEYARYQKWGDYEISLDAYKALLGEHYDVMASESYDRWPLMIAVPRTPQMQALLAPFADGNCEGGTDVLSYGKRLVAVVYCTFGYGSGLFGSGDPLERLVHQLAKIRAEMLQGDVSFLQAVASFYGFGDEDEDSEEETSSALPPADLDKPMSKTDLQQECTARGITFRKTWTKQQLRAALSASHAVPVSRAVVKTPVQKKAPKLSSAAQKIVDSLTSV